MPLVTYIRIQWQAFMFCIHGDQHCGISHWTNKKPIVVPGIKLNFQDRRRESVFMHTVTGEHVPDTHIVVRGG